MAFTAMWTHGNAVVVESPEALASSKPIGWGHEFRVNPGKSVWLHAPLPTPVYVLDGQRASLIRVFVLFEIKKEFGGNIRAVHIWDGPTKVWQSPELLLQGSHLGIDQLNTFNLPTPHSVGTGINVSVLFQADIGIDSEIPPADMNIAAVGGDYDIPR